ncbi:MAG: restriction endonuclease, partial [Blastocatellia bacterium]
MKLWMIRGGKQGEHESISLENELACIGFESVPDLSQITSKADLRTQLNSTYPEATEARISNI